MTGRWMRMSPSRLADALACPGRVREDPADNTQERAQTTRPAARSGLLVHHAFELCFSAPPVEPAEAWEAALAAARVRDGADAERLHGDPLSDESVEMSLTFLRFERAVARVRSRLSPGDTVYAEESLRTQDGEIVGTADLVVRGTNHWIADLKSGAVRDRESGVPRPDYLRQVQLYAVMEFEQVGEWPKEGWLVSLHGQDVRFDLDPNECRSVANEARAIAERLMGGDDTLTPSPESCRWCRRVATCAAPWEDPDTRRGLRAARVSVTKVEERLGEIWFEGHLDTSDDTDGPVRFRRVSVVEHPSAAALAIGCTAVVIGAQWSEHAEAWHLGPSSRLEVLSLPYPPEQG